MAKTKEEKKKIVKEIRENLKKQAASFFINFEGLPADDLFELRENIKEKGGLLYVAKKKLMEIAFEKEGIPFEEELLSGPTALVFSFESEIAPAKTVYEFGKESDSPRILGGVTEDGLIGQQEAVELAKLPSRKELQQKLVGSLQSPLYGLQNSFTSNLKGLLLSLNQISKQ